MPPGPDRSRPGGARVGSTLRAWLRRTPRAALPGALIAVAGLAALFAFGVGTGVAVTYVEVATWPAAGAVSRGTVLARPQFVGALALALAGAGLLGLVVVRRWRARPGWRPRAHGVAVLALGVTFLGVPAGGAASALWPASAPRWVGGPTLPGPSAADPGVPVDVAVPAADGVVLRGVYRPSANRAAVVVVPGSLATRDSAVPQAAALAARGYGVLLLDPRGNGDSGGSPDGSGRPHRFDIVAAVDWLGRRPDVDPRRIGVLGESMGGEAALAAAALDPRIAAVVAEGVTATVGADWDWLLRRGGPLGPLRWAVFRVGHGLLDVASRVPAPPTLAACVARAAPRPVLLIAAGTQPDEAGAAETIRSASPQTVRVWVVPGAEHAQGLQADPSGWTDRVVSFLDDGLTTA